MRLAQEQSLDARIDAGGFPKLGDIKDTTQRCDRRVEKIGGAIFGELFHSIGRPIFQIPAYSSFSRAHADDSDRSYARNRIWLHCCHEEVH